jgi:hypothetical protein
MAPYTSIRIAKLWKKIIGSMRYLLGNIVAHKLIKIKVEQGKGLNKQKTYHSFVLQIIIFSYIQYIINKIIE